ncbi:hypothetical protein [Brucella pituitosa]|uniref:Uncharacterized protein n=1 Tax=Brucella pituitosa TaxID=571256 RepID=A0ABS3K0K3_9HYPH|nr:hypothetical protein [Brucella pituitosa]MBO1040451.1 hypothetical protein [Brucella pituitosa]
MTNPLVKATLDALNNHPEEWVFTSMTAVNHKRNLRVWIGNRLYGLDINGYGDVTLASSLFGWFIPWRVRIWNAVWRAKAAQIVGAA